MLEIQAHVTIRPLVQQGVGTGRDKLLTVAVDQISRNELTGIYQARLCPNQKEAAWHPLEDDSRQWVKLVKSINKKLKLPKLAKGESVEV